MGFFNLGFTDIVKNAHDFIANYDALLAQNGKMHPIIYVFRGKNYYEMKDVQEIQAGPINTTIPKNQEEILAEIPDEIPDTFTDFGE